MTLSRRTFLRRGAAAISAASLGGITQALTAIQASAQTTSDYKALVGVFLYGGMDCHDTVIPYASAEYNQWASIRQPFLAQQNGARARDQLLPLGPARGLTTERDVALPPDFAGIHSLYQQGHAAVVGNIGPLLEPTDADSFFAESVMLPPRLFSHNDQQSVWMSGDPEGARYGWAGLMADSVQGVYGASPFTAITTGGGELLITGDTTAPFQVSINGATQPPFMDWVEGDLRATLSKHWRGEGYGGSHLLGLDMQRLMADAFDANALYDEAAQSGSVLGTVFPASPLGRQLQSVAQSLAIRDALGASRQVFVTGIGGFDTHDGQATDLPALQRDIDAAVTAFYDALVELGLTDQVTLFTATDFGRTLAVNGNGTDHGWGSHQFVVGGAVAGGQVFGTIPEASFDHPLDAGGGRLIPSVGVEQLGASLGQWFGVPEEQLPVLFAHLDRLGGPLPLFG